MLTIVFDLDGTLIDTAPDLIDTLNIILAQEDLPAVSYASARNMIVIDFRIRPLVNAVGRRSRRLWKADGRL